MIDIKDIYTRRKKAELINKLIKKCDNVIRLLREIKTDLNQDKKKK